MNFLKNEKKVEGSEIILLFEFCQSEKFYKYNSPKIFVGFLCMWSYFSMLQKSYKQKFLVNASH